MIKAISSSYRDPSGFIFEFNSLYYRCIKISYKKEYDFLMSSGLYQELSSKKLMVRHEEIILPVQAEKDTYKIIIPEQILFISYPFEWSFEQWKDILQVFLEINRICISYGMILKDATPFNFTFHNGYPIFIDTLSFSFFSEETSLIFYKQFCESMLGPIVLIHYNGSIWSRLFASSINGYPLAFISRQLDYKTYLNPIVLVHIHLHARYTNNKLKIKKKKNGMSKVKVLFLLDSIKEAVKTWQPVIQNKNNEWKNYYIEITGQGYLQNKKRTIERWLSNIKPMQVVDFGSNTGQISLIAEKYSESVISIDSDEACINEFYSKIKTLNSKKISCIVGDIMQISPGVGWNNLERLPLINRINPDTVLALAIIHHLCIVNNLPISLFASFINSITQKFAIIEFISKEDPNIQKLLISRKDIFTKYTEIEFENQFQKYFDIDEIVNTGSIYRKLYLFKKN